MAKSISLSFLGSVLVLFFWGWCSPLRGDTVPAPGVVINEIAWGGTSASATDEWIELYNNTGAAVDLQGWQIRAADGIPTIALAGIVPARGYFVLERVDDDTILDRPADQVYSGALHNDGEVLELADEHGELVDRLDCSAGWHAGTAAPDYRSLERIDSAQSGAPSNWASNNGLTRNGLDALGRPLNGTPGTRNSATPAREADLVVHKEGPQAIEAGATLTYTLILRNAGHLPAAGTRLTDVLPAGMTLVTHSAPVALRQPLSGTLVWELGTVSTQTASTPLSFTVIASLTGGAGIRLTNTVTATCATTETDLLGNHAQVVTWVEPPVQPPTVLIESLHYDGYEPNDAEEAVRLFNASSHAADLGLWQLTDGVSTVRFPPGALLAPHQSWWCTRQAAAFARQFGFAPDWELDSTDPSVPQLDGVWPGFANSGDECLLVDGAGRTVDTLVYGLGEIATTGWHGPALEAWTPTSTFAREGQILTRKRNPRTGQPVTDTDTRADWAQDPADHVYGRQVLYPGWDVDSLFWTERITETATLTVAVAPDNLYSVVSSALAQARESIAIETYSFRSWELAQLLVDRLHQGVKVSLLLEGAPAVVGVTDQEKWIVQQLVQAGADVRFMVNDEATQVHDRYKNQHAKLLIIDDRLALIGSENLSHDSFPADDKANGTAGRRGVYLATDAPGVVARVQEIVAVDADPDHHQDIAGCDRRPDLCQPPPGFVPDTTPDWITYTVQFSQPFATSASMAFEVTHAPENSLSADGLLGLLNRAGEGDEILWQGFYEYAHWGPSGGTPQTDPNPRLLALIAAARRGAAVRILLDSHFDHEGQNSSTLAYLRAVAAAEGLDLHIRTGDPTHLGLHNKMVLVHSGDRGYIHVGSVNGSEASSKLNREVALQVQSQAAHAYLKRVFDYDWSVTTPPVYLPVSLAGYCPPSRLDYPLLTEVYYAGSKDQEWVEIANPGAAPLDLSGYRLGDASAPGDFEGMYLLPRGTILAPDQVLVVAASAQAFRQAYPGRVPDFELFRTDMQVPTLQSDPFWGTGEWHLRNDGDEVWLLDDARRVRDVVAYGDRTVPGLVSHPGVSHFSHSLERYPHDQDSDDCSIDFRDWPFPNPGDLP